MISGVLGRESVAEKSSLELTEKSEAEEYLAANEPEVDLNDRAEQVDDKVEERSEDVNEKVEERSEEVDEKVEERSEEVDEVVEERSENVNEVAEENVEEVEDRSEEVDDNVEDEIVEELDFEDRSADLLKTYFLKNEQRLTDAEAEIKKLKSRT